MKPEILIVDSHNASRKSLAARLGRKGFLVHEAGGIEEAYQVSGLGDVDIILLDLVGFKEKALRHFSCVKNIFPEAEIILLTNLEQINISIMGMKMGAFDDLLTPVDVSALVSTVMAAWARKRQKTSATQSRRPLTSTMGAFLSRVGLSGVKILYGEPCLSES